jgi:hypothetical protein
MFIEEINKNECLMCLRPCKHYKIYKTLENIGVQEVQFVINCARCRDILRQQDIINEKLKQIQKERLNREWEKFCKSKE